MERQNTTGRPNEQQPLELDEKKWATVEAYVTQVYGNDANFYFHGAILSLSEFKIICGPHIAQLEPAQLVSSLDEYRDAYLAIEAKSHVSYEAQREFEASIRKGQETFTRYALKVTGTERP